MKKIYDYEIIEGWLEDGFSKSEKALRYDGNTAADAAYKTENKKEKSGRSASPALQLAGVFLAAAIVGGGTFGVLKYMEYKGSLTNPPVTETAAETDTDAFPETTEIIEKAPLISDIDGVKKYDYSEMLSKREKVTFDSDPSGFVSILTGGKIYSADAKKSYTKAWTDKGINDEYYDGEPVITTVEFGGDLEIHNNVSDREITAISVAVTGPDGSVSGYAASPENAYQQIFTGKAGVYILKISLCWDDYSVKKVGDSYTVYTVIVAVKKNESFNGLNKNWYSQGEKGPVKYMAVYSAGEYNYPSSYCCLYLKRKGSSLTERKAITYQQTKKVISVFYSDSFAISSNVYGRDMTVVKLKITPENGEATETTLEGLYEYLKAAENGTYTVAMQTTWDKYPMDETGDEAYIYETEFTVIKDGERHDIETKPAETTSENPPVPDEIVPDRALYVSTGINASTYESIYAPVFKKTVYKNGEVVSSEAYESDVADINFRCTDKLEAENRLKKGWRIVKITVVKIDDTARYKAQEFTRFETAIQYIKELSEKASGTVSVEAVITWDAAALLDPDADRTEYTFGFNVVYKTYEDIDPAEDPYVTKIMKHWFSVNAGGTRYLPGVSRRISYKGDEKTEFEYKREDVTITLKADDMITMSNEVYSLCRIYGVTVNGVTYGTVDEATENIKKDGESKIEVEISWDPAVWTDPYGDRNTYIYEFVLIYE